MLKYIQRTKVMVEHIKYTKILRYATIFTRNTHTPPPPPPTNSQQLPTHPSHTRAHSSLIPYQYKYYPPMTFPHKICPLDNTSPPPSPIIPQQNIYV